MKKIFIIGAIAACSFLGCEEDAEPISSKNPYAEFSVVYNKTTNKSTAKVFIWREIKGGRLEPIDKDEQLTYQEQPMQYQTSDGSYLRVLEYFHATNVFKLVDLKNNEFVNTISGKEIGFPTEVQYNSDTVNTTFPLQFRWVGAPLDTNEVITLGIEGKTYLQDTLGTTSITIPESELTLLSGKSIDATLERYKKTPLQQKPGTDGTISILFVAQPRKVVFKEGPAPLTKKNVYAEFSILHDAAANMSTGSARFFENSASGNQLFIDPSAVLQFQGSSMSLQGATGYYSATVIGFLSQYQFRFVDIDKREFINAITGSRISLPSIADSINTSLPFQIAWSEAGVDSFESVTVRIGGKSFVQDTLGKKSIVIPAAEIASFKGTSQQSTIERRKQHALQQRLGASGVISNRYVSQSRTIHFK